MFILKFRSEISFKFDFTLLMEKKKRCIQAMARQVAERKRERERERKERKKRDRKGRERKDKVVGKKKYKEQRK